VTWAEAYLRTKCYLDPSSHLATINMGQKVGECLFRGAGSPSNTMSPRPTSVPSGILIHPAVWQQQTWAENWGAMRPCPFGGLGLHVTQCGHPRLRPNSTTNGILVHPGVWPQQTWAENWGLLCSFLGRAGSPSNTMPPGLRHTSVPSGILIHSAIWPQHT